MRGLLLAVVALLLIAAAQAANAIEPFVAPPPTAATSGPASPLDAVLGFVAGPGAILGVLASAVAWVLAFASASADRSPVWRIVLVAAALLAIAATAASIWTLLSVRSVLHPFVAVSFVPLAVLARGLYARLPADRGSRDATCERRAHP